MQIDDKRCITLATRCNFVVHYIHSEISSQGFERWLVEDLYTAHNALSSTEVLGSVEEWRYNVTLTQAACDAQVTSCVSSAAQTFRAWMYSDCESW